MHVDSGQVTWGSVMVTPSADSRTAITIRYDHQLSSWQQKTGGVSQVSNSLNFDVCAINHSHLRVNHTSSKHKSPNCKLKSWLTVPDTTQATENTSKPKQSITSISQWCNFLFSTLSLPWCQLKSFNLLAFFFTLYQSSSSKHSIESESRFLEEQKITIWMHVCALFSLEVVGQRMG